MRRACKILAAWTLAVGLAYSLQVPVNSKMKYFMLHSWFVNGIVL